VVGRANQEPRDPAPVRGLLAATVAAPSALLVALALASSGSRGPLRTAVILALAAGAVVSVAMALRSVARLTGALRQARRSAARTADRLDRRTRQAGEERSALETILASMEDGLILIGGDGRVAYANPAVGRLLGTVPGALNRLAPARLRSLVREAADHGAAREDDIEIDDRRLARVQAVPLPEDGRILLVLRDVTEARRVEAMRRDFVASASHELKTPAASIQAGAETLHQAIADDPGAAKRFAVQLERDAVRLSRLVADLLDLSRLEAEERDAPRLLRLDRIAAEETERLRPRALESEIDLRVTTSPARVTGWPKDLAMLVRNLLDNAIRYTPPGGRIEVGVRGEEGRALLVVRDTGIGIPSRDLPRIFERFYRVDPARSRATGGTGLGLSIARHIAEQHRGAIHAASELGRGSSFTVSLPLSGEVPASEPPQRPEE